MFSNRNLLILSLSVILFIPVAFAEEKSERSSGIRNVKCIDLQKSILSIEAEQISEFDYTASLLITQNDGKCIMKNKLGKTYVTPWMPIYHVIYLKDMDYGIIDRQRIIIPDENTEINFNLYNEIPYCVEVVSVWVDSRIKIESISEICF